MESVTISLDGEIKGKGRPRFVRKTGRVYTPEPTRNYEDALKQVAALAMRGRPLMIGPLRLSIVANVGIPASWSQKKKLDAVDNKIHPTTKPDVDNIMKMLDAFNGVVWVDDAQVVKIDDFDKRYSMMPRLVVTVSPR